MVKIKLVPWINRIVNYCCTSVLLYEKMLKETETEETIVSFVTFLSLVAFQLRWPAPRATPITRVALQQQAKKNSSKLTLAVNFYYLVAKSDLS